MRATADRCSGTDGSSGVRMWSRLVLPALLALTLETGCWPNAASSKSGADSPAPAAAPSSAATTAPISPPSDDPRAGAWWVLMPDRPDIAFRLSLEAPKGDHIEGSWTSFDWRATRAADDLRHKSKGVKVTGEVDGETLKLSGPAPMLDANGAPNGQRGSWLLELKGSNLPGEPRRFAGHAISSESRGADGIAVTLDRDFRPWKP